MVRHQIRNLDENNFDSFRTVIESVISSLGCDSDDEDIDSGNGESLTPIYSPEKADEASAVLERLAAAEDSTRGIAIPDAWPDDAQTGLEPSTSTTQPSYDPSRYDPTSYVRTEYGYVKNTPPIYEESLKGEPVFERDQISYEQSGNGQPVPGQHGTGQNQLEQCETTPSNQGSGFLVPVQTVEEPGTPRGTKRKFYVGHEVAGQGFMLSLDDGKPKKIPRPPNAFMLYANEYRRVLARQNPNESNKEISVRLGNMWKTMQRDVKERYFDMARAVDAEHKKKYPNYVYNPKEARMRKAIREQTREYNRSVGTGKSPSPSKRPSSVSSQSSSKSGMGGTVQRVLHDGIMGGPGVAGKKGYMPMYPPGWGEMGTSPYVVPDFVEVGGTYQNNEQGGAVYPNMIHSPWYPYYAQQEHAAAYGQSWSQHPGQFYLQQQQQRMQQMQHAQSAVSQPAQGYIPPFDDAMQQAMPAKPPAPAKPAKPVQEDVSTQPTSDPSTASTSTETLTVAKKSSQPPNQVQDPTNRLPAFVQAFGKTEIGRYHNDNFASQNGAENAIRGPLNEIEPSYEELEGFDDPRFTYTEYQRDFYPPH